MSALFIPITILIVLAAMLLVFIVLIQNSKGGGLASGFSSSNAVMGVRKTTDFLEKATWSLAGFVIVMCIVVSALTHTPTVAKESEMKEQIQNAGSPVDPNAISPFENQAPANNQGQQQAPEQK